MVEFEVKINPEQRVAYLKRAIVDRFGYNLGLLPDTSAAFSFPKATKLPGFQKN